MVVTEFAAVWRSVQNSDTATGFGDLDRLDSTDILPIDGHLSVFLAIFPMHEQKTPIF